MKPKQDAKVEADKLIRNLKRATRRTFGAEEEIRIVLAGLRGEDSIAELCRREGLHQNLRSVANISPRRKSLLDGQTYAARA